MSWCWFNLVNRPAAAALASAAAWEADGTPAGYLAVWPKQTARPAGALRLDQRAIDPTGAAAWVSLVRPPAHARLPFDDPAVSNALRAVLADLPVRAVSTLLLDDHFFEGAVTVLDIAERPRLSNDPFARLFPARHLYVETGLFGRMPAPAGPCIQRYGSGRPWPWDRFASH